MRREPPAPVRRRLAEEVGFGCPVPGCGSPYLTWHHFDPPWSEREHHEVEGMVALCRDHHPEADAGAFTVDQLRDFKSSGRDRSEALSGKFNWMREELLAVVGGNFYHQTPVAIQVGQRPVVWFNRDEDGRLLVNLDMLTTSGQPRLQMRDNFWITEGSDERQIECPPSGRLVKAAYPNDDKLTVEFREVKSLEDFDRRYKTELPAAARKQLEAAGMPTGYEAKSHGDTLTRLGLTFPFATVEITMDIGGTDLRLGPKATSIGTNTITGGWTSNCRVGVQIS